MKFIGLLKKSFSFLSVAVLASICTCVVFAQKLDVNYKDLTFYLDGQRIDVSAVDANNNQAKPFIANGITYVPVSSVAKAFGKDVSWNDKNEIFFTSKTVNNNNSNQNSNQNLDNTQVKSKEKLDAGSNFSYSDLSFYKDYDDPDEIKVRAQVTNNSGRDYRKANFEVSAYDANGKLLGSSIEDEEYFNNNTTRNLSEDIDHLSNPDSVKSVKIKFINGY